MTLSLVSTVTVGAGGAASISFTGIPQTGTDLLLVVSARSAFTASLDDFLLKINGANTNLTTRSLLGSGSSASSFSNTNYAFLTEQPTSPTASTHINAQVYIPNYAGSTTKPFSIDGVSENNATAAYQHIGANLWNSTSAITGISISCASGSNLDQYSTASLYTVTKGSGGASVA